MVRRAIGLWVLLAALAWPGAAWADKYDLQLSRLYYRGTTGDLEACGQNCFDGLMADIGTALAPRFLGPAATLGALGFNLAVDYSLTNIDQNAKRWQWVMRDPSQSVGAQSGAEDFLQTVALHVRKGLPFSAEVGGTVTKLMNSGLWGMGLEIRFAPLEGFKILPEIGFGGTVSTFLGTKDYALLTAGWDVTLSKKIGVAGLFKIAPYAGYNGQYVHGSSNVIYVAADPENPQKVFGSANELRHFGLVGLRVIATVADFGFEAALTQNVQVYSFRLGVEF